MGDAEGILLLSNSDSSVMRQRVIAGSDTQVAVGDGPYSAATSAVGTLPTLLIGTPSHLRARQEDGPTV